VAVIQGGVPRLAARRALLVSFYLIKRLLYNPTRPVRAVRWTGDCFSVVPRGGGVCLFHKRPWPFPQQNSKKVFSSLETFSPLLLYAKSPLLKQRPVVDVQRNTN